MALRARRAIFFALVMSDQPFPIRVECPPGACTCGRAALSLDGADARILQLTREEELRLLARLERIADLADLRHMQQRLQDQLGMQLYISTGAAEVRSLRGITVSVAEQVGLCRKTRQTIPTAIKNSMEHTPQISSELLDEGGLFA